MESIERVLDEHKALIRKAIEDELDKRIRKEVSKRLTEYRQIAEYLRPEVTRKVLYAMMERKEELVAKLSDALIPEVEKRILETIRERELERIVRSVLRETRPDVRKMVLEEVSNAIRKAFEKV